MAVSTFSHNADDSASPVTRMGGNSVTPFPAGFVKTSSPEEAGFGAGLVAVWAGAKRGTSVKPIARNLQERLVVTADLVDWLSLVDFA